MKPLHSLFLLCVFSIIILLGANCSGGLLLTTEIPSDVLQQKLDEKFPVSVQEQDASVPLDISLSDPELILEEGNDKLGFRVTVEIAMPEMPADSGNPPEPPSGGKPSLPAPSRGSFAQHLQSAITGKVTIFGGLRYDAAQKAIYITDLKVTEFDFAGLPDPLVEPASRAMEQVLAEKFATEAIYLPQDEALIQAATAVLKDIRVENGKLLVEFGL
ncbi:MAG: DUF1439 domain-containing protein [Chloroflexi bacterium]|nr:DUF1439 domain-containing protein [Chloroflexota bacterium]